MKSIKRFAFTFIACLFAYFTQAQPKPLIVGQKQGVMFTDLQPDVNYSCDWVYPNRNCSVFFGFDVNRDGVNDFDIYHSFSECMFYSFRGWSLVPRSNVEFVADSLGITPFDAGDTITAGAHHVPDFKIDYSYDSLGLTQRDTTYFIRNTWWLDSASQEWRKLSYSGVIDYCPGTPNWSPEQSDTNYFAFRVIENTDTAYGWAKLYFNDSYNLAGESFAITGDTGSFVATGLEPVNKTEPETKLYPNPVSNELFIESPYGNFDWQIFTVEGKMIKQSAIKSESINVSKLPAGMYFLKINNGESFLTKRFIKE